MRRGGYGGPGYYGRGGPGYGPGYFGAPPPYSAYYQGGGGPPPPAPLSSLGSYNGGGTQPMPLSATMNTPSPAHGSHQQMYACKPPPFDPFLCEQFFPKTTVETEESSFTQILLNRHQEICPTTAEQTAISSLVTKIRLVLDKIVVAPDSFTAVSIEEVREVGSFKKGTMLTQHNIADIAVILKTLPTVESVNALGQKIVKDLRESERAETFGFVGRDYGCEIAGTQAVVRLLVTILPQSAKLLEPDLHLPEKIMQANMATIRHARWFEEHATHSSIKHLIRLIKYIKTRYDGFKTLNIWCIEILAHYCVMNTPTRTPLALSLAFRRFFQMLSTGIYLPNSPGLLDPCDPPNRVHFSLEAEDMDMICSAAQTLTRIILHGGTEQLLSCENGASIANDVTIWGNVVVTPLEKAYSAPDMEPYFGGDEATVLQQQPPAAILTPQKVEA